MTNAGNCNRSDRWLRTRVRCSRVNFPPTASSGETATFLLIARVRRRAGDWHSLGPGESIGPLEHPASVIVTFSNVDPGAKTINWDERVQVQIIEPAGIKNYQVVEESVIRWDGIGLAEAIRRCKRLSSKERARVSILTTNGSYDGNESEALYNQLPE
jgi:hypothetical protein